MNASDWIQTLIAVATCTAVIWAIKGNRTAQQELAEVREANRLEQRATHNQRVHETCSSILRNVADLQADLMPYWKDEALRREFATVPAEVAVHRAVERVFADQSILSGCLASDRYSNSDSSPCWTQAKAVKTAAAVMRHACLALYLSIIPDDPTRRLVTASDVKGHLDDALSDQEAARALAHTLLGVVSTGSEDAPRVSADLIDLVRDEFVDRMANYLTASSGAGVGGDATA